MQHPIPLGTKVAFAGDPYVYEIADYQTVIACPEDCSLDHDCFPEPHVCVSYRVTTLKPLKDLNVIFDQPDGFGREPLPQETAFEE